MSRPRKAATSALGRSADDTTVLMKKWAADPVFFVTQALGRRMWSKQIEIIASLRDNYVTCVVSANGMGKDWSTGRGVLWFLLSRANSIVVTTAPTKTQDEEGLWAEVRTAARRLVDRIPEFGWLFEPDAQGKGFSPNAASLRIVERWKAKGIVSKDVASYSGNHGDHVMCVIDEAAGVPSFVFKTLRTQANNPERDRILIIGYPTCPKDAEFAQFCKRPDVPGLHKSITISALQSPSVVSGQLLVPASRRSPGFETRRRTWARTPISTVRPSWANFKSRSRRR